MRRSTKLRHSFLRWVELRKAWSVRMSPSGHEVDQLLHRKRRNRWRKCDKMSRLLVVGCGAVRGTFWHQRCGSPLRWPYGFAVRVLKSIRTDNCVYCSALEVRNQAVCSSRERHPIAWHLTPLGKAADITIAPVVRTRGRPQTAELVPGTSGHTAWSDAIVIVLSLLSAAVTPMRKPRP